MSKYYYTALCPLKIPRPRFTRPPPLLTGDFYIIYPNNYIANHFGGKMKKGKLITNFRELPYNPDLKYYANEMRNQSTKGEIKFWCELLRNRKSGYQFKNQ
jgi:hypothetical protein